MKVLLFAAFIVASSALCVQKHRNELFCLDETYFDGIFLEIEKLTLEGGFIAPFMLESKFPILREIEIINSDFQTEQCSLLSGLDYKIVGCPPGKFIVSSI